MQPAAQCCWWHSRKMPWHRLHSLFLIAPPKNVYWCERRSGERQEREREKCWCEKQWWVASRMHADWGSNPQHVAWPGIEPATVWCTGQYSNQLSHLASTELHFYRLQRGLLRSLATFVAGGHVVVEPSLWVSQTPPMAISGPSCHSHV